MIAGAQRLHLNLPCNGAMGQLPSLFSVSPRNDRGMTSGTEINSYILRRSHE